MHGAAGQGAQKEGPSATLRHHVPGTALMSLPALENMRSTPAEDAGRPRNWRAGAPEPEPDTISWQSGSSFHAAQIASGGSVVLGLVGGAATVDAKINSTTFLSSMICTGAATLVSTALPSGQRSR